MGNLGLRQTQGKAQTVPSLPVASRLFGKRQWGTLLNTGEPCVPVLAGGVWAVNRVLPGLGSCSNWGAWARSCKQKAPSWEWKVTHHNACSTELQSQAAEVLSVQNSKLGNGRYVKKSLGAWGLGAEQTQARTTTTPANNALVCLGSAWAAGHAGITGGWGGGWGSWGSAQVSMVVHSSHRNES